MTSGIAIAPAAAAARPAGHVLMIVGPDGTGKTTLCNALERHVQTRAAVRVLANRRGAEPLGLLPSRAPRGSTSAPHRHAPRSAVVSIAKLVYAFADFYLGWLIKVRPFVRRGGWVVVERGWWDMLVDPVRYRLRLPHWLGRVLAHLTPRPTVVLVLEAPTDVITARKAQLTVPELRRQMETWRAILPRRQRRIYVNTDAPISDVLEQISGGMSDLGGVPGLVRATDRRAVRQEGVR